MCVKACFNVTFNFGSGIVASRQSKVGRESLLSKRKRLHSSDRIQLQFRFFDLLGFDGFINRGDRIEQRRSARSFIVDARVSAGKYFHSMTFWLDARQYISSKTILRPTSNCALRAAHWWPNITFPLSLPCRNKPSFLAFII